MRTIFYQFLLFSLGVFLFSTSAFAADRVILLDVSGYIGPATQEYVQRGIAFAEQKNAKAIIIRLNSLSGSETAVRRIDEAIAHSSVPVISFIPPGSQLQQMGAYLLYASHLAAMAPDATLGMALPSDTRLSQANQYVDQLINKERHELHAKYARALQLSHNRNGEWVNNAVMTGKNISGVTAKDLQVIDNIATNYSDLLNQLNGRTVIVLGQSMKMHTTGVKIENYPFSGYFKLLQLITHPSIVYLLFILGLYALLFHFIHKGSVFPGLIGIFFLMLSFYAFQVMPINYSGLTLLLIGIALMIFEVYVISYGVSGALGVIAFILGSLLLFDMPINNYPLVILLVIAMSFLSITYFYLLHALLIVKKKNKPLSH